MRFIHFSDTHLGFSETHKIDPRTGINQREQDFYDAWFRMVEAILEKKPDFVLHTGDLFHTTRPSNRAIAVALEGIQKISNAGIPFVVLSGNHSTPRIKSLGSIFEAIELFPNVYAAYQGKYERFRIGECDIHCVPHCALSKELEAAYEAITILPEARFNVFACHGAWAERQGYSMGEFNEQRIPNPETKLGLRFDYLALGHYHKHIDVSTKAAYPGSTERTSFNEVGYTSGYLLVDLEKGNRKYLEIPSRKMIKLPALDCSTLTVQDIYKELEKLATNTLDEAMVSLELVNIQHDTFLRLDPKRIDAIFERVFYLEKYFSQIERRGEASKVTAIEALPLEFERYVENLETIELDKERLKKMGVRYLEDAD
ncbi:MAG: exonuclease SbcCD subunit D [candidate division KSB1 bacterium]|nr:exonuclease SbcCD subunit D [candidate division KSB1 bacterium]